MKKFAPIFICILLSLLAPSAANAIDEAQAIKNLESMVNTPERAKEYRRRIKNSSKEDLKIFDELRETMQKEINSMSSTLPKAIDKYTTMNSADITKDNIIFRYTLSNKTPGINNKSEFISKMTKTLNNGMCTSPAGAYFILGYVWSYYYFKENGAYIGSVIVNAKTCGFE